MVRGFISLCVALACVSAVVAQEPAPKRPDLPDLGKFDRKSADWGARRWCDGNMLTVVSRSPFSVTAATRGGEFESEIARHSCNQECRGAAHEVCVPGSCYSVHTHDEGLKLKWDQTKTDEIATKISASLKAALPKGAEISGGVEQEIKKSITNATSAEQTLRGCLADACTIRTEAGGFLLKVNPGQVVVSGYHTFTVVFQCTSVGHWLYPDSWYCSAGKVLNSWYSTEITDIQFHGGVNMTFTKWLVPGPSCACKPGHTTVSPPPDPPWTPTGDPKTGKDAAPPEPPRHDGGCGCGRKNKPSIVLPPSEPRSPWSPPRWSDPWPPVDRDDAHEHWNDTPRSPAQGNGGVIPPWFPPGHDEVVPPWSRRWTDPTNPGEGETPTDKKEGPIDSAPAGEPQPPCEDGDDHEER